jgi:iron complex outermembrane receptor protein
MDFLLGLAWIDMDLKTPGGPDLNGNFVPSIKTTAVQTPEWNVNGLLRYGWLVDGAEIALQADFVYRSEHYFSISRADSVTEDGYIIGNARLSYTTEDRKWEGAFFVKNIADEEYLVQTFDLSDDLGMTEQYYGRPRWIGGSIRYTWD